MAEIRKLSASIVNKIAAGEVIERPASVVKELLENAVDSGASQIEVAIEKGGSESIRVTDNGCGMSRDQLPLAVSPHATSKIVDADDLFSVSTMGFRGEALASIAEVSHLTIRSREHDSDSGHELSVVGGESQPIEPVGCPPGTSIEVRNLFFNTPVRRKYLKTPQTEMGHISEAFARVALAYPRVQMTLRHNQRTLHQLPACEQWADRIGTFFGEDIQDALIPVTSEDNQIRLSGYVVDPTHSRGHNRMQYLILNGRYIRDRSLQHALGEAYRGLLLTGRYPIAFLRLDMPPELVDVNVHPAKLEVRFQDGGRLYSQLLGTLRNRFLTTDLTARAKLEKRTADEPVASAAATTSELTRWARDPDPRSPAIERGYSDRQEVMPLPERQPPRDWTAAPRDPAPRDPSPAGDRRRPHFSDRSTGGSIPGEFERPAESESAHAASDETRSSATQRGLQLHNRYLVSETEEGMIVIDQHALHERIIYEQLREKVLAGKLERQQLLVPEPVNLSPAEVSLVTESTSLLEQVGIVVQPFGGSTVLISAYPAMLAKQNPAEMLRAAIERMVDGGKELDRRDILDELLHLISCKAAVKAGDRLTPDEIDALIQHRDLCQDSHHCPHGRPTALVFSREELDRRFKRI